MKTLQIDGSEARKFYPGASPEFRATLEATFGKEFFNQKVTDRIKTLEDALVEWVAKNGEPDPITKMVLEYEGNNAEVRAMRDNRRMWIIAEVLNEGWVPDFGNGSQQKWYPWFTWNESGFGFSYSCTNYGYSLTHVGSRLCFRTRELSDYAGRQFTGIYNGFLKR